MKNGGPQSTLTRGFLIVEKIVQAERPVSSAYIAEALGLPRATVHRIAQQLEQAGYLQREPGGKRFTGGRKLRCLAVATLSNSLISAHRTAILQALSDEIGETCNLTVLEGSEIFYLERIETNWPYRIHLPVGSRLPLYCTATGKLFLANMKPGTRRRLLGSITLVRHTDRTITDLPKLEQELEIIRQEGVGYDTGEYLDGMVSLAVPVIDQNNQMFSAIAVHAPAERKPLSELRQYLPALRRAAGKMAVAECDTPDRESDLP